MNRGLGFLALAGLGCASVPEASVLEYESAIATRTAGVAYLDRGELALVGMFDTSCDVYTTVGRAATDYAFPGTSDVVLDAFGGRSLVATELGAWLDEQAGSSHPSSEPVRDGLLLESGLALLEDPEAGCTLRWTGGTFSAEVAVPTGSCDGQAVLTGSRATGELWIADGDLTAYSPSGEATGHGRADLAVWDATTELLYVGTRDGVVRGLDASGVEQWATTLDGTLQAVEALGTQGVVVVVVEAWDGQVDSVFMDGWSGLVLDQGGLPSAARHLSASADGTRLAVQRETSTAFFRVPTF